MQIQHSQGAGMRPVRARVPVDAHGSVREQNWLRPHARTLLMGLASALALACQGDVGSGPARPGASGGAPGGGSSMEPGAPSASDAEGARQQDDAMRADDPQLFEIASKYFPGTTPEDAPARLARLTRIQLDRSVQALLPSYVAGSALASLPRDPLQTNYEYAQNLGFNSANFTPFTAWVGAIKAKVLAKPEGVINCAAQAANAACLESGAQSFARKATRQVIGQAQLDRTAAFFAASVKEVGVAQATADLVDVVLTSPSFVFRNEVPASASSLSPAQWAQSLSYTLADAPPEALGMSADDATKLADKGAREQIVERVLATPDARAKLQRFFLAWLEVKEPADFTISTELFPEFTPQLATSMVDETRSFLDQVLAGANPSLKQITQATRWLVSEGMRAVYGLPRGNASTPSTLDPSQRLGIFSQPAVIASHSGPSSTRLVKRGVFFTRKVMCQPLGAPPQGVDTMVPESDDGTERQRIEAGTNKPACQGCHQFINPFGFMQESYDPIGRFRTRDNDLPVNPAISLPWLDEPFSAESTVEALQKLSSSMRFQQCFVRQLFRFYMGRDETSGDDPVLRQMFFQLAKDDAQDIGAMLRTLAGSSALWARKAP